MSYFLPSYFQKRLLRYVLTRLDFIETDALNLEDLDITLGQRSVIELKNVGIKVSKLIERLQIPSSISLHHASVRFLRITIPADLHISGIAVELDGIDVHIELQEDEGINRRAHGSTLGRGDVASRPRIPSTSLHDPGGHRTSTGGSGEHLHVIPTSQDLAMSFLESEPVQEREELEAAIQSQSQRLSESTPSLDGSPDESGIGMPGGFSLPGFVAKFFAGVADRLTVSIKNVTASAAMKLPAEASPAETVKIMIKVAAISLDGLQPEEGLQHERSQRSIEISGFEVFLLSEAEAFTRSSTTSSPKLTKSHSKMSYTSQDHSLRQFESPEQRTSEERSASRPTSHAVRKRSDGDVSSNESAASSQLADLSMDLGDSLLADHSTMSSNSMRERDRTRSGAGESTPRSPVDNRRHAEQLLESGVAPHTFSRQPQPEYTSVDDLAESSLFTHDQAESMYMSAVSDAAGMPGAWGGFEHDRRHQTPGTSKEEHTATKNIHNSPGSQASLAPSLPQKRPSLNTEQSRLRAPGTQYLDLVAKQLLYVNQLTFSFPSSSSPTVPDQIEFQEFGTDSKTNVSSRGQVGRATTALEDRRPESMGSRIMQSGHTRSASSDFVVAGDYDYVLSIDTVAINIDMAVGRILISAASQLGRYTSPAHTGEKSSKVVQASFSSNVKLQNLYVSICQSIPEVSAHEVHLQDQKPYNLSDITDTCLLQLRLTDLKHELAVNSTGKRQRLIIQQIILGQSSQKYLYFVNSLGLQDSVATSLVMRPNDLVVTNVDDRFEVQIKPLYAVIDLLKVDDVLSRSGGLSSILDLGNSIISTGTITETSPKPNFQPPRQRAVRFDSPAERPRADSSSESPGLKIDVRISGAVVDLIGSECSVQVRSSAVKLVSRAGNLRTQIDTVVLNGPVLGRSMTKAGVNIKITNLSVQYKDAPEEQDLDRLLSLLTPSGDKYDEEDDIMVDTLIRQRRKGAVLRLNVGSIKVDVSGISWLKHVSKLGDELSKLATVTKYLPEDDRPGILTFALINKIGIDIDFGKAFGLLHVHADLVEGAIISVPSLMAAQISSLSVKRGNDIMLGDVIPDSQDRNLMGPPMLMCRFIADEMEPTVRIKLFNACFEYTVPTMLAVLSLLEILKLESAEAESVSSGRLSEVSSSPSDKSDFARKVKVSLAIRDSAIALNPSSGSARGLALLSDTTLMHSTKNESMKVQLDLRKASILIIDDTAKLGQDAMNADQKLYFEENDQVQELTKVGYVPVGSISNASAIVNVMEDKVTHTPLVDIEFRNNLFLLETCADSTQTLIQILSSLAPPSPPSPVAKYRTEIVPIQDMLASFTGNAFVSEPGPELGLQASQVSTSTSTTNDEYGDEEYDDDESEVGLHDMCREGDDDHDRMTESYLESELSHSRMTDSIHIAPVNPMADQDSSMDQSIIAHSMLDFRTDHFVSNSTVGGTAHRWNSSQNTYGLGSETRAQESPLKVKVRDMHIIWNLFDGYDWQNTRDTITQAVKDIESKAMARRPRRRDSRLSPGAEDDESVIGDFLFNSIYIGIPANKDPRELANAINQDIGDMASETGSYATGTTVTASPSGRATSTRSKPKKLRLNRSRQHKMTFELRGVSADMIAFPSGSGEVESSVDVRVRMLEIFDHVPTSTWKKFATYMHEAGEREVDTNMVHLEILNVKPVAELSASEIVLKVTILPLRLHVDQDALDFLTRFFEFKDERAPVSTNPSAPPFLQRAEVNPIRLRLDFKPKRVDYGGLRSGRTTEFMNFFVLDRADMVLRRVILYGVSGFDRLGIMLNNIWSPDVKKNQLPTVLAGLAPIRSLVDVGSGVKDLVAVPIREYKKDGRIVRSIQKGAIAFAKTTTTELVNLGAKLAIGTQTVLQNAEGILVPGSQNEDEDGEKELISLYADQPVGIVQGLRGAYASLERDLLLAKDAIVAIPGEVMASGSATGAAKAVIKQSPTIILRPAIGATKAVGQTLLGAGNTLDKGNLRRIENKYKHR